MSSEKTETKTLRVGVVDIEAALKEGYPITCATCTHFYAARATENTSCGKTQCGGPIIGRDFPEYNGQIPRNKFAEICLRCGSKEIVCHVLVYGREQKFGLCEGHKSTFDGIIPNVEYGIPQTTPIIIPLQ